jgi:hypothetical protein
LPDSSHNSSVRSASRSRSSWPRPLGGAVARPSTTLGKRRGAKWATSCSPHSVIYLAGLAGGFLGLYGALALTFVAYYFFIYTMPAAAIGGVPGGGALNVSVERARRAPLPTLAVTVVYMFAFTFVPTLVVQALSPVLLGSSIFANGIVSSLLVAVIKAIVTGYVALVLAKTYEDVSYGRSF